MKSILLSFFLTFTFLNLLAAPTPGIVNIPDANFKAALLANNNINTNSDTEIQATEAATVINLSIHDLSISDLTGISAFTSLVTLQCYSNSLATLDVSSNTSLTLLDCGSNSLTTLDVSTNTALLALNCNYNFLSSLDVTANTSLTSLICNDNPLTSLNVSTNIHLSNLICSGCRLTTLDISADTALTVLDCFLDSLIALDVSNNLHLSTLNCSDNLLSSLDVSKNNALIKLECSNNDSLPKVCISTNQLVLRNNNPANWVKPGTAVWTTGCLNTTVGIEEKVKSDLPKILIHIYNIFGQEVDMNEITVGDLFIYQYSDGTVQKIVRL